MMAAIFGNYVRYGLWLNRMDCICNGRIAHFLEMIYSWWGSLDWASASWLFSGTSHIFHSVSHETKVERSFHPMDDIFCPYFSFINFKSMSHCNRWIISLAFSCIPPFTSSGQFESLSAWNFKVGLWKKVLEYLPEHLRVRSKSWWQALRWSTLQQLFFGALLHL